MKLFIKIIIGAVIGGMAGFAYYYFIGCSNGSCPITSHWDYSTLYGVVVGVVIAAFTYKSKKVRDENTKN